MEAAEVPLQCYDLALSLRSPITSLTHSMFMFSAKVKDQQESRFLSKHFYTLFLINSFSQE